MAKQLTSSISKETLNKIIIEGKADVLVQEADALGEQLVKQKLTTSQIRAIFGTVRQIERRWNNERSELTPRDLILLKPKMMYRAGKEKSDKGEGLRTLAGVLNESIDLINGQKQNFKHFVEFFEAILAYHSYHGGKES